MVRITLLLLSLSIHLSLSLSQQNQLKEYKDYLFNPDVKIIANRVQVGSEATKRVQDRIGQHQTLPRNKRSMPKKYSEITDRIQMMDITAEKCREVYAHNGNAQTTKNRNPEYGQIPSLICFIMKNYNPKKICSENCIDLLKTSEGRNELIKMLGLKNIKLRIIPELENGEEIYMALNNSGIAAEYERIAEKDFTKPRKPIQIRTFSPIIKAAFISRSPTGDGVLELRVIAKLKGLDFTKIVNSSKFTNH